MKHPFDETKSHPFTEYPKHLYHATLAPKIVYNTTDEQVARAGGHTSETYIPQDTPKLAAYLARQANQGGRA